MRERPGLPAIALTANTSDLTAIGNDYGYDRVFARLVEAHGRAGDVAVAISTSGNSPNVLEAVAAARQRGLATIGLCGRGGGKLAGCVDVPIVGAVGNHARASRRRTSRSSTCCASWSTTRCSRPEER